MRNLLPTLLDYDPGLLLIIANRWDVDLDWQDKRTAVEGLVTAMLEPGRAANEWGRLSDIERGTLQTLLAAPEHRMPEAHFVRLFGELRQMGPGKRERDKPHLKPVSVAEVLFYRGLLARGFHQGKTGVQPFIYVPDDLAAVLPVHETGFVLDSEAEPEQVLSSAGWSSDDVGEPDMITPATTTLVDDLTTTLAYVQLHRVPVKLSDLIHQLVENLREFWLTQPISKGWIALVAGLAIDGGLMAEEGQALKVVPTQAKRWLDESRPRQVRALAETWRNTRAYNELWHTPGLQPEETGWRNDPLLARQTLLTFLEAVPPDDWWSIGELIALIKDDEPDFQRPAGDYGSWYIRSVETGEYLRGFDHWDQVDGAVLRFILTGPMHWLGLVDLANNGTLCRLTAYGRALCDEAEWPDPAQDRVVVTLRQDGTALAPRTLSRYERFQLARITEWRAAGDPYEYALTAAGLEQAAQQNIQLDAIRAFLRRASGGALPESIELMLERWGHVGQAGAWMTRAVVLRTDTPDMLRTITETPELRRFLGATLGPTAVLVRPDQEDALAAALQQQGILVEFNG